MDCAEPAAFILVEAGIIDSTISKRTGHLSLERIRDKQILRGRTLILQQHILHPSSSSGGVDDSKRENDYWQKKFRTMTVNPWPWILVILLIILLLMAVC